MPRYYALDVDARVRASDCELSMYRWKAGRMFVDFALKSMEGAVFRATMRHPVAFRMVDQLAVGEEDTTPVSGIVPDRIAYMVKGAAFYDLQGSALKDLKLTHYRMILPDSCIDFISKAPPTFALLATV